MSGRHNAEGEMLAADLAELHTLAGRRRSVPAESGEKVNGQWNSSDGDPPNEHDIMTGSDSQGMLLIEAGVTTIGAAALPT